MIPSVLPTYNRAPMAFVSGAGSWLTAEDGSKYLDLGAGIAVNALGHAHPALVKVLTEQAGKLWHVSNLYRIPEQERLANLLVEQTFAQTVFFTNSGTEACELAIKMARKYWYHHGRPDRVEIITFEGAFHGRSTGAIAAAGSEKMVKGFGPLMPGFRSLPWGDHDALRSAITDQTCAVLVEPVQGEGGIRVMPDACLKGLRDVCDETGTLMILDEVQCGMGRTGRACSTQMFPSAIAHSMSCAPPSTVAILRPSRASRVAVASSGVGRRRSGGGTWLVTTRVPARSRRVGLSATVRVTDPSAVIR